MRLYGKIGGALALLAGYAALAGCSLLMTPGSGGGTDPGPGPGPVPGPTAGPMAADIVILDDPVGGRGVTSLACAFEVTQIGTDGTTRIQIRVDWSASCGTHKSETFTFRGGQETFSSTYEDPTGHPLSMTFWVTIRWTDSRGSHVVRSGDAACT